MHSFEAVINTTPHIVTIIGTHMLVVSNEQIHTYQADKSTVLVLQLPSFLTMGPLHLFLDLTPLAKSQDKFTLVTYSEWGTWMLASFPKKCLVKDLEEEMKI